MNPSLDENKQTIILEALQNNFKKIDGYESVCFIAAGNIAGILGLTNIKGLIFFLVISLTITVGVGIKLKFDFHDKMNSSFFNAWWNGVTNHVLSFVLFWTLAYALVYIY